MQVQGNYKLSQLKFIFNGLIIGILAGIVVSLFRWSIQHMMTIMQILYTGIFKKPILMLLCLAINLSVGLIIGMLLRQQPDIKGSGIPQVKGQLRDELDYPWWSVLWRKFVGGILAIGSGLYL
ncbi:H(+)/Cl(-) exchange transporter ClcA [Lentilactobacillus hilgardii]|nr:H(+)/Cl(-) exchange transporter ClcA [Lentilactobacillus hilgardii]